MIYLDHFGEQAIEAARATAANRTVDLVLDIEFSNSLLGLGYRVLLVALATCLVEVLISNTKIRTLLANDMASPIRSSWDFAPLLPPPANESLIADNLVSQARTQQLGQCHSSGGHCRRRRPS